VKLLAITSIGVLVLTQLDPGNTDVDGSAGENRGSHEQKNKYETPRPKTVIRKNGQITPADEREGSLDLFAGEELSILEMDAIESSIPTPVSINSSYKRKASNDLVSSPLAKLRRIGKTLGGEGECTAPSLLLFNEAMVAQVRGTGADKHHEAMHPYEQVAYTRWIEQYQSGSRDPRLRADEFRELQKAWKSRCGICWFSRRGGARMWMAAQHTPDTCPQKGLAIWRSAMQRADVIQSKVLRKRVWPASSGCWKCGLPAWRCDSFEQVPHRFFRPWVPEVACQDKDMLRHIAGSVLAHFEAGAACVVAQVKESWGREKVKLESQEGIDWLQDYAGWTSPECSYFALVVFELEKFGTIARALP
jgi:hypothetical protein